MRVLIVEDDRTVGEVLRDLCGELGHEAEAVRSAEDALVRLEEGARPDLILLDYRLPRMSGLDFLRLPLVRNTGIPIVVVSGIATESQAQECLALGAVKFLAKPVPFEQLHDLLEWFEQPERQVDRRRNLRASVALPVRVRERDGREWQTTTVDLSLEAVKVLPGTMTRPGPTVELSFMAPGEDQSLQATSILLRIDSDGYVFYFLNLTEDHFERLSYLVRRLTSYPKSP